MSGFQLERDAAQRYEQYVAPIMAPFVTALLEATHAETANDILDVACGTGFAARAALAVAGEGTNVHGADVNGLMLAVAEQAAPEISWHEAPADALPFGDVSFDVVLCQQGLQFLPDAEGALHEMVRVTRPSGRVGATTWAPLDVNPYFAAQRAAIGAAEGDDARVIFDAAFDFSAERLHAVLGAGGLHDVHVAAVTADITLPALRSFARDHLTALPWGAAIAKRGSRALREAADMIATRLGGYLAPDESATLTFTSWLATGSR